MTEWNDEAVVLRLGLFRESDIWLKVLFRQYGLATVFAFGGAKSVHRFCGCLDLFNSLECRVKISKNGRFLNLMEAVYLAGPKRLRWDWRLMGMASNCMRFLEVVAEDASDSSLLFDMLVQLRNHLENSGDGNPLIPLYFRFSIACAIGFRPDLFFCGVCQQRINNSARFIINEGKLICTDCANKTHGPESIYINDQALAILRKAQLPSPEQWCHERPDQLSAGIISQVIENFVAFHLGIGFGDTGFIKSAFGRKHKIGYSEKAF